MPLASIPSPGHAVWHLGPLPVRAYALCVVAGILVAVAVASRRYRRAGIVLDVAAWAVPFALAGALAHAILLDNRHIFGDEHRLWHDVTGGIAAIGVPGAVALGALGAWIACRRARTGLGPVAGAAAPALAFGLAIGGLGDWWTQQFYGPPSTWWWAVQIAPTHRAPGYENYATFQPVFLYQSLWEVALGFAVIWAARRFTLSGGRTFMLCAAGYAAGGVWVETLRVGPLPHALGVRYGALGDIAVFVLAAAGMYLTSPGRRPQARKPAKRAVVEDSSGDVMSV
jgi:phosphatidylglycerol---prolipoprotein diacylglyceryl transferase